MKLLPFADQDVCNPIGILAGIVNPSKPLVTPERNKLQDEASTPAFREKGIP